MARDKKASNAFEQNFETPKFWLDAGSRQKKDSALITPSKGKFFQRKNHKGNSSSSAGPKKVNSTLKNFSNSYSAKKDGLSSSDFDGRFDSLKECTKFLNFDPESLGDKAGERSEVKPFELYDMKGLVCDENSNPAMSDSTNETSNGLSNFLGANDNNSSSIFSNLNLWGGNGNDPDETFSYFNMFNRDLKPDENQWRDNSEPRREAPLLISKREFQHNAQSMIIKAQDMPRGKLADNGRRESDSFGPIMEIDSEAKKNEIFSKKRVRINPAHPNSSDPAKKPTHSESK
jgi:hypothetical protein